MFSKIIMTFKALLAPLSNSLRTTLVFWFLMLSIMPFVSVAWYGYVQTVKSVDEMQRNKLANTAAIDVETLKSSFYEAVRDLHSWSTLQELNQQSIERLSLQYDYVYDLFLIDLEGNIRATVAHEADFGTNLQSGPYSKTRFAQCYRKTLSDGKAHFSDLEHYAPSHNLLTGFITQPIRDGSGKMIGVMGLQLNMDVLFGALSIKGRGLHQYLVGVDGLLRTPYEGDNEVLKRRIGSEIFWSWYKEHGMRANFADTMVEDAIVYAGPNGKMVLGEHKSIDLLGVKWAHISEIDQTEVMSVPNKLFQTLLIFVGFMLAGVVLISIMIARRIVKPIEMLSAASEQYIKGIKGIQVNLDTNNEIGEFGHAFNELIQKQEYDGEKLQYLAQKAQKTLDELKEQKYALDAHSIVAITDVKGTITFVNSKFEEITGYTSKELIGQNHRILNSGVHNIEFWKEMYHAVSHGNIWKGEVCNTAKDGHSYWVDTTIVPFMGEDGKPVSYIAIRTDISARKNAEIVIAEKEGSLQTLLDSVAEGIYGVDINGYCTFANRSFLRILEFDHENEILGKHIHELIHHSHADGSAYPSHECKMYKANQTHQASHVDDEVFWKRGGESIAVEYWSYPMMRDGIFVGAVATFLDISERKVAEAKMIEAKEAAEASARVKSEFLATMSHEIRTPMNGVLGMLGLLGHSNLDETQKHQIRVASNSANSLLGIINDILDFSKVEAGKMELEMIEFNLRDELGEFVEAIAFRAQEKGLELILDTTKLTCLNVITDPGRLRQILTNLIGNAVKFTHRGEILIAVMMDKVDEHSGRLRIDVRDSGIGIAPDKIGKLFETFSQADNSTTRKYGGTGLGLAIVKKLCELMDGTIWITSVEYEGSTFHIDIGVGLGEKCEISIPSVSVAGKSVLVVDDNETNRVVVRAQLEQWGMEVYEAEDPIIAFDYCQVRIAQGHIPPYDVALLDMQMPNMDGADLGAEIRNMAKCDEMKMIMMTSLGHRNDAARFAQIGFDAFFAKPTTTKDLLNALKVLFDEGAALEAANPLITKDFLGMLQDEISEIVWPSNTRILLVEDNPTNQIVAQGMLDMIGLEADIANNGLEALEAMELALGFAPYTIILMDCQMPEMDGYTASTAIREGRAGDAYKEVPIVAMTANAMAGDREKCLMSGMSDYVSKPINLDILKTTLMKWMDGKVSLAQSKATQPIPKSSVEEETEELKVWDEADALKRLGGKKELLHKIMESFVSESMSIMGALGDAIDNEDLPNAQLHAHSIKGSSANVSGQKVNALAKMLEYAAKNADKKVLKEGIENLKKEMEALNSVFQKELTKDTQPQKRKKRLDPLQMAIKLQNLKKEIEAGTFIDTDAVGIFGEYADEAFTTRMSTLKGHIDRFDADSALEQIEAIMAGLE